MAVQLGRRHFLRLAFASAAVPVISGAEDAGAYPSRPVRIVVGFAPGGGSDILARLVGQWLSERLHQPFIVENRPGASTSVAAEMVARAAPDGYTLLMYSSSAVSMATLNGQLNFNPVQDIAPVASIARAPLVMLVNPSFPSKTVPEFIAYAKANPGKIVMASSGAGGTNHLAGALLNAMAGVEMLHVPYRGDAPALADLIGGQVQVYFGTLFGSIEFIRTGRLRALAVTAAAREAALPDLPTLGEHVRGYEVSIWNGLGAPKDTPAQVVERLNQEVNAGLADATIMARLAGLGITEYASSPAGFGRFIAEEAENWGKVIKSASLGAH
jgi:tripartite-type tricarboxylate transporter receptor subunit TctC